MAVGGLSGWPLPDMCMFVHDGIGRYRGGGRMTVETPEELSSDLLDLTSTSLSEMRTLHSTVLDRAVHRTLDRFRLGEFGDSVQEQLKQ
jgi:hypothetical protein